MYRRIPNFARLFGVALMTAGLGVLGCANGGSGNGRPIEPSRAIEERPLLPEWRQFALDHYQPAVLANMNAPTPARFTKEPEVIAEYDPNSDETLITATGEVDEQGPATDLSRSAFAVSWRQTSDLAKTGSRFTEQSVSAFYTWPLKPVATSEPVAN